MTNDKRELEKRINPQTGKLEIRRKGDDFWEVVVKK